MSVTDMEFNVFLQKLVEGTEKEKRNAVDAILADYKPQIENWAETIKWAARGVDDETRKQHYQNACQEINVALFLAANNYDPNKVQAGHGRNYFNRIFSSAKNKYISDFFGNGIFDTTDVKKVDKKVIERYGNGVIPDIGAVKQLILQFEIRKKEETAEKLANFYIFWKQKKETETIDNADPPIVSKDYGDNIDLPDHSYLEVKEKVNGVFRKQKSAEIIQKDNRELEIMAQQLSLDYNELVSLKDNLSEKSRELEIDDLHAFMFSMASCLDTVDNIIEDRKRRNEFEKDYRAKFNLDHFCLDEIGFPNKRELPENQDVEKFKSDYKTYFEQIDRVPVFNRNYLSARKIMIGSKIQSVFRKKAIITPADFSGYNSSYREKQFPFTDFNDAENNFLVHYLESSLKTGNNDSFSYTYVAMLILFKLLQGYEGRDLNIPDSDGAKIPITEESLLMYAERSFFADYSTGRIDGYLGAMIYAIGSELFSKGPVKSKLFLVKQIFEQIEANGIVNDAYSYMEEDLYNLYFSVCRIPDIQRFTFSDYIEDRSKRYDILQVWEAAPDTNLEKLVKSNRKKAYQNEWGEAYRLYKDSLRMLLNNSDLRDGKALGSELSFNLLILDLAYPYRPLSNVVNACFKEPEFQPMLAYYMEKAQPFGVTLTNQDIAFLYCMQNGTNYLTRLAVSLVAHHCVNHMIIENYKMLTEAET